MELLVNGLLLMLVGMGTVFAFLGLMVFCIYGLARVVEPFSHLLPETATVRKPPRPTGPVADAGDDDLLAVITAAVHRYRKRQP